MAQIRAAGEQTVFHVERWLGLNESPDGDTTLKNGELSVCQNFRVTREGHLKIRSGSRTVCDLHAAWAASSTADKASDPTLCGLWHGQVGHGSHLLAHYGGLLLDVTSGSVREVGCCTQDKTTFFGFSQKVYLLNGHEYLCWDGGAESTFEEVIGYVPTVATATPPAGGGTLLENVNRLNGFRRQKFSPDGAAKDFQLAETEVDEVIAVSGTTIAYTLDKAAGKVSFSSAPVKGTNTVSITYRKGEGKRAEVTAMRFSELYNGATDARVFLYGDGSNRLLYSGLTDVGTASAEYFPDLYELRAGEENTPVTAAIRHYGRLLVFKTDSAWSVQYDVLTTALDQTIPALYVTPLHRQIGNLAPGQAVVVENNPVTFDNVSVYEWRSTSSGGASTDTERNVKRISERVESSLSTFDGSKALFFNHKEKSELYVACNGEALVYNYGIDTWYRYTDFPAAAFAAIEGVLHYATANGLLRRVSSEYRSDDGAEIDSLAATGSMDFGKEWLRKYMSVFYVAVKPESGARVIMTVESNRKSDYAEKVVAASLSTFSHLDFNHVSFATNRKPQVERIKLKVKKATFVKLVFKSRSASATATILSVAARLRYTGYVK